MSFDQNHYKSVKEKLNNISSSFCVAKWMHVTLHLHIGKGQSCYHCEMHDIPSESLAENPSNLHNTQHKALQRQQMLQGQRPTECNFCWQVEDLNGISDRYNMSGSEWTAPGFDLIDKRDHLQKINPSYLEVSFSNACNFRCSYCSASASSRWHKEISQEGAYPVRDLAFTYLPALIPEEENPWIKAWWAWLPDLYPNLRYLRITGGEPLLSANTFKLLEFIATNPNPNLDFAINSNMGSPKPVIERFVSSIKRILQEKQIRNFTLFTSVDTWGPQAEYIRNGLDLELFLSNIRYYLAEIPEAKISFMITFQIFSLPNFSELLLVILALKKEFNSKGMNRIEYSIDHLVKPTHQHLPLLPESFNFLMDNIEKMMKENTGPVDVKLDSKQLDRFQTVYRWMKKNQNYENIEADRADFYRFFSRHDQLRGVRLLDVFPEYSSFWQDCERASNKLALMQIEKSKREVQPPANN